MTSNVVNPGTTLKQDVLDALDATSGGKYSDALVMRRLDIAQERLDGLLSSLGWADWLTYWVAVEVNPEASGAAGLMSIPLPRSYAQGSGAGWSDWGFQGGVQYTAGGAGTGEWTPWAEAASGGKIEAPDPFAIRSVRICDSNYTLSGGEGAEAYSHVVSITGKTRLLEECQQADMFEDVTSRSWSYDDPPRYRLMGEGTLTFDRKSPTKAAFLIEYTALLRSLELASWATLQPIWGQYVVTDTIAELAERDRDFALADRNRVKLQQLTAEIEAYARRRHGAPKAFRDELSRDTSLGHQQVRDRFTYGPWWPR